jgi:hypothetical protein
MSGVLSLRLAVGVRRVAARWIDHRGTDRRWTVDLGGERSIADAMASLASIVEARSGVAVFIALLPPLVRARRVGLPPMTDTDRELAVARAGTRHFIGLAEPVVCAAGDRQMMYAAGAATLAEIESAVRAVGWRVQRFSPAHLAWRAGAVRHWPDIRRGIHTVHVAGDDEWMSLELHDASLTLVRRARAVVADRPFLLAADPVSAAAEAAAQAAAPGHVEFLTTDERARRSMIARRTTRWLAAAAAVLLVAAAGIYHAGLLREQGAVLAERDALRSRVLVAMRARDSLSHAAAAIAAVARLEASAPRWSAVMSRAAIAIPPSASLLSFRAEGDSARFDGSADDATAVFARLQQAAGLVSVRPAASIRQEATADERTVERWSVTARVDHRKAVRGSR